MKKIRKTSDYFLAGALISGGLFAQPVFASDYAFPIAVSGNIFQSTAQFISYQLNYLTIPVYLTEAQKSIKPCTSTCQVVVFHKHYPIGSSTPSFAINSNSVLTSFSSNDTWDKILKTLKSKGGGTSYIVHTGEQSSIAECVGVAMMDGNHFPTEGGASIAWSSAPSYVRVPPGYDPALTCLELPPVPNWCAMETGNLNYTFDNIRMEEAVGKSQTLPASVYCTGSVNYVLKTGGVSDIPLTNGMIAKVTLNTTSGDKNLGDTLTGKSGSNPVNVKVTLSGTPTSAGPFNGNSVLFVSYP
ncbi:hypothetical protein OGV43_05520 [Citrobacter sp. Cb003]|uniref:hypothetical protein n=1 Tax=Citrobacter sp. Cb003 TaxID=2985005 RepID=UPI0025805729|nr:hypothetical protein [Citrobacter sp. Cb003]MDM3379282.1 hypothetical protein [Citrobacter sp. Cb003]